MKKIYLRNEVYQNKIGLEIIKDRIKINYTLHKSLKEKGIGGKNEQGRCVITNRCTKYYFFL